jgi:hypothetical protein
MDTDELAGSEVRTLAFLRDATGSLTGNRWSFPPTALERPTANPAELGDFGGDVPDLDDLHLL